jgi:hypothetical protein
MFIDNPWHRHPQACSIRNIQYRSPIAGTDFDFSSNSSSSGVEESTDLPSFRTTMKISPTFAPALAMKRRPLESKVIPVGRMQPGQSAALILSILGGAGLLGRFAEERIGITAVLLVLGWVGMPFAKVIAKSLYPSGGLRFLVRYDQFKAAHLRRGETNQLPLLVMYATVPFELNSMSIGAQ